MAQEYFEKTQPIEALQYTDTTGNLKDFQAWLPDIDIARVATLEGERRLLINYGKSFSIRSLRVGDWLVKDWLGNLMSLSSAEFENVYRLPLQEEVFVWRTDAPEANKEVLLRIQSTYGDDAEVNCYKDVGYLSGEDGEYYYNSKPYAEDFLSLEVVAWCEIPE